MEATGKQSVGRVLAATLIGAMIEWYDFFLYGVVAGIVCNMLYFLFDDPAIGTMRAYGIFAAGFLSRPFGGIVFGHFAGVVGMFSAAWIGQQHPALQPVGTALVRS